MVEDVEEFRPELQAHLFGQLRNAGRERYFVPSCRGFRRSFDCRRLEKRAHLRTREWKGRLRDRAGQMNGPVAKETPMQCCLQVD